MTLRPFLLDNCLAGPDKDELIPQGKHRCWLTIYNCEMTITAMICPLVNFHPVKMQIFSIQLEKINLIALYWKLLPTLYLI
jgi:hypothetical protein